MIASGLARSSVAAKVRVAVPSSPSVTLGELRLRYGASSLRMVPVAVAVAVTAADVPETLSATEKVSSSSTSSSSVVATVNVFLSPAVPAKTRALAPAV